MKKAQLASVITIVLLVAAVAGFLIFSKYNVGRAPGDLIAGSRFEIQRTPLPTPQPTLAPVGGGYMPQSTPQPTPTPQSGGFDTTTVPDYSIYTSTPEATLSPLVPGSSFIDSTTCDEVTGPCELDCKFKEKDAFAMSKEPSIDVEFTCPGTKGILKLGYSLSAGSYRGFDAMIEGGDYKGAYDCARKEGTFFVTVELCSLIDWIAGKK